MIIWCTLGFAWFGILWCYKLGNLINQLISIILHNPEVQMALTKNHRLWNDSHYNTGHLNSHTKEWRPITNPTRLATTLAAWRWERIIETADISLFWTDSSLLSNCIKNSRKCCLQSLLCCFLQYPPICVLSPWTPLKPRWWQQGHSKMIYWKTTKNRLLMLNKHHISLSSLHPLEMLHNAHGTVYDISNKYKWILQLYCMQNTFLVTYTTLHFLHLENHYYLQNGYVLHLQMIVTLSPIHHHCRHLLLSVSITIITRWISSFPHFKFHYPKSLSCDLYSKQTLVMESPKYSLLWTVFKNRHDNHMVSSLNM